MLSNYFKIAWRNLRKQPGFTLINIIGLAAGLVSFAFIALWVNDELSYDRFNQHYGRVVRLLRLETAETSGLPSAQTGAITAQVFKDKFAEIEHTVRLRKHAEEIVHMGRTQRLQPTILLTEPSFFSVFSYRLSKGNPQTALQRPYTIVLTESTARLYFGDTDPMGKVLTISMYDSTGRGAQYTVTGVCPDPPRNAHFTFTMLGSIATAEAAHPELIAAEGWTETKFYTYFLLREGVDAEAFSAKVARFQPDVLNRSANAERVAQRFITHPLADIHLRSGADNELAPTGDVKQVYIFATIGLFILLLAGINYTNLATARAADRAREVGVKKVMGATLPELMTQYLTESVLLTLVGLVLAGGLAFLLQPIFTALTNKPLSVFSSPLLLLFLLVVAVALGLLSGLYPALVLASFKPIRVLSGTFKISTAGNWSRQSLVVVQFVVSLLLIISVLVIHAQMAFVQHKDLGYAKDALLFVRVNGSADVINGYAAFRHDITGSPRVNGVATSNSMIVNGLDMEDAQTTDAQGKPITIRAARLQIDTAYLSVYGVRLLAGQDVGNTTGSDRQRILLNEQAVKQCGWPNAYAALGKPFTLDGRPGTVVGVVRDFHYNSLQHAIEPLAITPDAGYFSRISIRVDPRQISQSVAFLKAKWASHFPDALFDYGFVDSAFDAQYQSETRFATVVNYFSLLALLIACLGLYGLIAYATVQRRKEIGVRKVLGASVASVVGLLSKDFLKLVLIAIVLASPVAWYAMNRWLESFAYRITIGWWVFALAGLLAVGVALLTVSFQAIKAALMNPVKSLRSE
ncbi:ABC transporter permease [Fibrella aquatilis]|uniref:ABC transporter permease n=1 Tax=Fibrella aquatilis TaxID=2817059 RepID=A0A939G567_9BACT|nr:ABC transporter permease [Fibrella aquatilis]MBO0930839.1 ABC transporter permease [Fibrella aquatilis]